MNQEESRVNPRFWPKQLEGCHLPKWKTGDVIGLRKERGPGFQKFQRYRSRTMGEQPFTTVFIPALAFLARKLRA